MRFPFSSLLLCVPLLALAGPVFGQAVDPDEVPRELRPCAGPDETILDFSYADLNGDGARDVAFIVEQKDKGVEEGEGRRTLKIAIRTPAGRLQVVKENRKVVYCRSCGGVYGDPYEGLEAGARTFSVSHYGGSSWRWANTFTFAYSKRDNTWQLVRVDESSFHVSNPEATKSKTYRPPRDFGKIDIADFDPDKYRGVGPK